MGIIESLLERIKGKKEQPSKTFILREEPDVIRQIEDAVKRENAQLKARLAELEAIDAHRRKTRQSEVDTRQVIQSAIQAKKKTDKKKATRRSIFRLAGKPVRLRNLSETTFEYPYLYGIEVEAIDDEPDVDFRFNILLSEKKERKSVQGRIYGSPVFRNLFKNPNNVVNSLQSGVIDLSVNDDGMFQPTYPQNVPTEIIINSIKGEYGEAIANLQATNQKLRKRLSQESVKRVEAEKREVDVRDYLDEVNATLEVSQKIVENRGSILSALLEKIQAKDTETMRFLIPALEAPLNKSIHEMQNKALENLIDRLDSRINEIIPEGKRKAVRRELVSDFAEFKDMLPKGFKVIKEEYTSGEEFVTKPPITSQ